MNPRIPPSQIGDYYPRFYYTHTLEEDPTLDVRRRAEFCAFANRCRGYSLESDAPPTERRRAALLLPIISRHHSVQCIPFYVPEGSVLDVGCGNGITLSWYRYLGWKTAGVEISSESAHLAQQAGHAVFVGELHEAGYPDQSFDAVTLWDALEHIHNPAEVMREIHRIIKPGGQLYLSVPNFGSLYGRLMKDKWYMFTAPVHYYHYNRKTLTTLLAGAGFHDVNIISYPGGSSALVDSLITCGASGPLSCVKWLLTRRRLNRLRKIIDYLAPHGRLHARAVR